MATFTDDVRIGAFASQFGHRQRTPESIEGWAARCQSVGLNLSLQAMGCGTFWQMTEPLESYVLRCAAATINTSGIAPEQIDYVVLATTDENLCHVDADFSPKLLGQLGLRRSIAALISLQQCVSSLAALHFACGLLRERGVRNVLMVAFEVTADEADRIRPFALFGDAVASCMVSRQGTGELRVLSYASGMDFEGLQGRDNFASRKQLATDTLQESLREQGVHLEEVEKVFSTNMYKPITQFNCAAWGVPRGKLYTETLQRYAHCGNCDWMINLMHCRDTVGLHPGKRYLIQSSAPGFFGCSLVEAC